MTHEQRMSSGHRADWEKRIQQAELGFFSSSAPPFLHEQDYIHKGSIQKHLNFYHFNNGLLCTLFYCLLLVNRQTMLNPITIHNPIIGPVLAQRRRG